MNYRRIAWSAVGVLVICLCFAVSRSIVRSSEVLLGGPMLQLGDADGQTAIYVVWRTKASAFSVIRYRLKNIGPETELRGAQNQTAHSILLTGLTPGQEYEYSIIVDGKRVAGGAFTTFHPDALHFRFAVLGDSGSGSRSQYAVAERIADGRPDFILHTGDLIYPNGDDKDYCEQFYEPYKDLIANKIFFPALGNHDDNSGGSRPWLANFVLPGKELYYHFEYGNADFIALNSNDVSDESVKWLDDELSKCGKDWKIVFFHHPPHSNAKKGDVPRGGHDRARELWLPILEKHKVDLIFCGHDHLYTRFKPTKPEGPVLIVEGCGGKSLRGGFSDYEPVAFTDSENYGFGEVEVAGSVLHFRHITADGDVLDSFLLDKRRSK